MNCDQVRSENIIEQYLLGHLDDADRDAFEEHFFSCSTCHEALQTYRALQSELREEQPVELTRKADAGAKKWTVPLSLAASVAAAGVIVWAAYTLSTSESDTLMALSSITPPQYVQTTLRQSVDEAQQRYGEAMTAYSEEDWQTALKGLEKAAELDPKAANISFFLGVCQLLTDRSSEAVRTLRQTTELGDSPYLEEAYFYLAKAHLGQADRDGAIRALEQTVSLHGRLETEAQLILQRLTTSDSP